MTTAGWVLLVEDSDNDAKLTLAAFEEAEVASRVVVLNDGAEALDYLFRTGPYATRRPGHPAVVVLDLKLPRVDGLEVLGRIKADADLRALPVVMLTSSSEPADVARSYALGVNAYVVKPVSFPDFMAALRELARFWAVINEPPPASAAAGRPRIDRPGETT